MNRIENASASTATIMNCGLPPPASSLAGPGTQLPARW